MNSENHNPKIVQIERYLMGEMQDEELKTFKQRLAQDPELQNEVQTIQPTY
jgi:anti-sigma factor RsiW